MRAEPEQQRMLLELAETDTELARLAHRRKTLPEAAEVARLEAEKSGHRDAAATVDIELEDLDRDIRKLEQDVDGVRKREERNSERLAAGGVPAKQLSEMEHENASLARRRSTLEDELLEIMERREAVAADHDRAGAHVADADARLDEARALEEQARADADLAEQGARERREAIVSGGIDAALLREYELQHAESGIGAALLRARRCGGCRMEIDRAEIERIKAADPAEVVHCEECGAILVRTGESGLGA